MKSELMIDKEKREGYSISPSATCGEACITMLNQCQYIVQQAEVEYLSLIQTLPIYHTHKDSLIHQKMYSWEHGKFSLKGYKMTSHCL
jgi:hypothetical protein